MGYYVVDVGTGRSFVAGISTSTHIARARSRPAVTNIPIGPRTTTLCGRTAVRNVEVFEPGEASCRECRKRWQLAMQHQAAEQQRRASLTPAQRKTEDQANTAIGMAVMIIGIVAIVVIVVFVLSHLQS